MALWKPIKRLEFIHKIDEFMELHKDEVEDQCRNMLVGYIHYLKRQNKPRRAVK